MSPNPSAHSTARRNLEQRIERFLSNAGAREIGAWECGQLVQAIEHLRDGNFLDGERSMLYAERSQAFEPANFLGGDAKLLGIVALRDLLRQAIDEGSAQQ